MDFKQIGTLGTPIFVATKNQLPEPDGSYKGIFFKTTYDPSSEEDYPKGTILTVVENNDGTFSWSKFLVLEKLTNGITDASQLQKDVEAFDGEGNKIIGSYEKIVLPTLDNEGTAADLATGKQLISGNGEIIIGTGTIVNENKLALVVSASQDINEGGYNITADDLRGVTEIRDYAFYGCAIKTADLINITKIGRYAFQDDYYLESVQFNPNGVQMDAQSFSDLSPIWTNNTDEEGFTVIAKNLCGFNGSLTDGVLNVKNGVEIIADNINLPYDMTQVILPEGLKIIGGNAFNYKTSLSSITFPTTIEEIKWSTFSNSGVAVLDLSNAHSLKTIRGAFTSMNLENVILPEGLEEISDYAFQYSYIKDITIPSTVKNFGIYSFQSSDIENVFFSGNINDWANIDFSDSYGTHSSNPAKIADNFYIGDSLLEGAITIIPKEAEIKYDTFCNQKKITSVTIENGNNESIDIATRAFYECEGLTYVELPSNIKWIYSKAFATSSQYPSTQLPKRTYVIKSSIVPFIEEDTFLNNNIEKIIVPKGCGETYKTAMNWTNFASYIEEATE